MTTTVAAPTSGSPTVRVGTTAITRIPAARDEPYARDTYSLVHVPSGYVLAHLTERDLADINAATGQTLAVAR